MKIKHPEILNQYAKELVGSMAIRGEGNDYDIAVLITDEQTRGDVATALQLDPGLTYDGSGPIGDNRWGDFVSLSGFVEVGDGPAMVNYLLCGTASWRRYTAGAHVCKTLQDMGIAMDVKPLRVFVHQMVAGASPAHALVEASKYK